MKPYDKSQSTIRLTAKHKRLCLLPYRKGEPMNNGTRRELSYQIEYEMVYQIVGRHFGKDADKLTEYVFEVMDWRSMTFSAIILHLQDVVICEVCEEATHIDYAQSTEGMVGGGLGTDGTGYVCDYCKDTLD